jgi:hypothetical protein
LRDVLDGGHLLPVLQFGDLGRRSAEQLGEFTAAQRGGLTEAVQALGKAARLLQLLVGWLHVFPCWAASSVACWSASSRQRR